MSTKSLRDAQASVRDFLNEAMFCAENCKGFAAMCTVFPVILAVSEALNPSLKHDRQLIQAFVEQMTDKQSWLVIPSREGDSITDQLLAQKLSDIRDALAHQLSQPVDIILVNNVSEVVGNPATPSDKWFISTTEFIEVVRDTANRLIEAEGHVKFDPEPRSSMPRSPSEGGAAPWGASASGVDLKNLYPPTEDWGRKPA